MMLGYDGLWVMGYGYEFGLCPRGFCSDCSLALTSPVRNYCHPFRQGGSNEKTPPQLQILSRSRLGSDNYSEGCLGKKSCADNFTNIINHE